MRATYPLRAGFFDRLSGYVNVYPLPTDERPAAD